MWQKLKFFLKRFAKKIFFCFKPLNMSFKHKKKITKIFGHTWPYLFGEKNFFFIVVIFRIFHGGCIIDFFKKKECQKKKKFSPK